MKSTRREQKDGFNFNVRFDELNIQIPINLEYDSYGIHKDNDTGLHDNWVILKEPQKNIEWDEKHNTLVGKYQRKQLVSVQFENDTFFKGKISLLGKEIETNKIYYFIRFDDDRDFGIFPETEIKEIDLNEQEYHSYESEKEQNNNSDSENDT